ncbi:MAG: hypothetical protein J7M17_06915 [Anaerolineae bacterium]|nr:hypothetical protein [Anaerolineae bacterium]
MKKIKKWRMALAVAGVAQQGHLPCGSPDRATDGHDQENGEWRLTNRL